MQLNIKARLEEQHRAETKPSRSNMKQSKDVKRRIESFDGWFVQGLRQPILMYRILLQSGGAAKAVSRQGLYWVVSSNS